jgi:hypothetical protein
MAERGQKHRTKSRAQQEKKHPDRWEKDLNPNRLKGQNIGPHHVQDYSPRTAADIKELARTLTDFNQDELRDVPIAPTGSRLQQGGVYLDLRNPAQGPVQATAEMVARDENLYVPKAEIPSVVWNRLLTSVGLEPDVRAKSEQKNQPSEEMIDKASADSFPTSDPPSWTTGRDKKTEAPESEQSKKRR